MTIFVPQQTPWTPLTNREIADAHNNIVQYTLENVGLICLAVNSHQKLMDMLVEVEDWLIGETNSSSGVHLLEKIRQATGRIGPEKVADLIKDAPGPSAALDRAISMELQCPEMPFTSNTDIAMSLTPPGWRMSIQPETGGPSVYFIGPDDISIRISGKPLSMAICEGAMRARIS